MALAYLSMEATFIFCVVYGVFLVVAALIELAATEKFWRDIVGRSVLGLAVAVLSAFGVVAVQAALFKFAGLGMGSTMPVQVASVPGQAEAGGPYPLQILGWAVRVLLTVGLPMVIIGVPVNFWFKFILPGRLRESRAFDLAALVFTLSLFMSAAAPLLIFNPVWRALEGADFVNVGFFADGNFPTNDLGPVMRLASLVGAFVALSRAIQLVLRQLSPEAHEGSGSRTT